MTSPVDPSATSLPRTPLTRRFLLPVLAGSWIPAAIAFERSVAAYGHQVVAVSAFVSFNVLLVVSAFIAFERAWPERRWTWRLGAAAAGAILFAPVLLERPPAFIEPIAMLGLTLVLATGLYAAASAFARATQGMRSLRSRILALVAATAVFALGVTQLETRWGEHVAGPGGLALLFMAVILPVWGFVSLLLRRLTGGLERSVQALGEVERGRLDFEWIEEGRDEIARVAHAFNAMIVQLREKAFLERAFGQYVTQEIWDAIRKEHRTRIPTERRDATVLYADIRGFTAFSESSSPEEVMRVLNVYFEAVLEVIARHGGYVNKFIGDAIMVVFNAPLSQDDHPQRAVACARAMQAAVAAMNARSAFGGKAIQIGIGVNSGPLVAGSLGGEHRAEYTVIGDTVNVAARLTSKAAPGEILIGGEAARRVTGEKLEPLPPLPVKGKSEPLVVFRAA